MCDRHASATDSTADLVLADLLTATEDLLEFTINVLDTIRLQMHFNDRNRRINLGMQLKDASNAHKRQFGFVDISTKPCTVATTLKYDLALYLGRILLACKRTKANLMLLRVTRARAANTTLLLVASTSVRVEQLNKKVQLLTCLVKENGGDFQTKKKKKKKKEPQEKLDVTKSDASIIREEKNSTVDEPPKLAEVKASEPKKKPAVTYMSNEDLNDYVEIALSFRMIISKYREFIQLVRNVARSNLVSSGQATVANSIVLVPIASNAINELNNILNRLIRIAYSIEAESNYSRRPPSESVPIETKELYRQRLNDTNHTGLSTMEMTSNSQMLNVEQTGSSRAVTPRPQQKEGSLHRYASGSSLKRSHTSALAMLKQNVTRSGGHIDQTLASFRNQSAMPPTSLSNAMSFKLKPNMIANIFEDFFIKYE